MFASDKISRLFSRQLFLYQRWQILTNQGSFTIDLHCLIHPKLGNLMIPDPIFYLFSFSATQSFSPIGASNIFEKAPGVERLLGIGVSSAWLVLGFCGILPSSLQKRRLQKPLAWKTPCAKSAKKLSKHKVKKGDRICKSFQYPNPWFLGTVLASMPILFAQSELCHNNLLRLHTCERTLPAIAFRSKQQPNNNRIALRSPSRLKKTEKAEKNLNDNEWKWPNAFFPTWA